MAWNEDLERGWSDDPSVVIAHRILFWLSANSSPQEFDLSAIFVGAALMGRFHDGVEATGRAVKQLKAEELIIVGRGNHSGPPWEVAKVLRQGQVKFANWCTLKESKAFRRSAHRQAYFGWAARSAPRNDFYFNEARSYLFGKIYPVDEHHNYLRNYHSRGLLKGWDADTVEITPKGLEQMQKWSSEDDEPGIIGDTFFYGPVGNVANNSQNFEQKAELHITNLTPEARQEVHGFTDAFIATLPVLGLDGDGEERAHNLVRLLRAEIDQPEPEQRKIRAVIASIRDISVSGGGAAAGVGIVVLADHILKVLGLS